MYCALIIMVCFLCFLSLNKLLSDFPFPVMQRAMIRFSKCLALTIWIGIVAAGTNRACVLKSGVLRMMWIPVAFSPLTTPAPVECS